MNNSVALPPPATTASPHWLLYALIGAMPLAEFMQTGVVAFNAGPVMGSIGASPEEYSLVATLYAVVAIGMISHHRWVMERLGWRLFIQLSCALFGCGAVVCGASDSLVGFAVGRALMAAGGASFMTAGRVLVNHIPPSPRRFNGIR
ncbi:MAG: MFS transporter, partial [Rhodoferax sp.]